MQGRENRIQKTEYRIMKNMVRKTFITYIALVLSLLTLKTEAQEKLTQEKLTLENAIRIGLENNYSIRISRNDVSIDYNNYSLGNAGFLPTVDLKATGQNQNNNMKQVYAADNSINKYLSQTNLQNAGVQLNWTIFDGMNMFISYSKLKQFKELGEIDVKFTVEENLQKIIDSYYDIVRLEQLYSVIKNEIGISEERVKIAQEQYNLGGGSKLELLQAQVDLNADRSSLLRQETAITKAKLSLNQLLGLEIKTVFTVDTSMTVKFNLSHDDLFSKAMSRNKSLLIAEKSTDIASMNLSGQQSLLYPKISAFMNYNFSNSDLNIGDYKTSQYHGLTYGLNVSLNLFDGLNTKRQIENARVSLITSQLQYEDVKNRIRVNFEKAFKDYTDNVQIVKMEEENLEVAKQTAEVAIYRFRYGTYSPLELRIAQKALEEAHSRLITSKFNAKQSETELLKISGELLQ